MKTILFFILIIIISIKSELIINSIIGNKYKIIEKLGKGGFGSVYKGQDIQNGNLVAIKIHNSKKSKHYITNEVKYFQYLNGIEGIPKLLWYGRQSGSRAVVMELLGDNLESYLFSKNGSLPISFVVNVAIQMLTIIQQIHSRYLLHRDIKPRNIVLPYTQQIVDEHYTINDMSKVYLIDFGLSKLYVTSNLTSFSLLPGHIPFSDHNIHSNITGTSRFASISVLTGYEPSRRDDLESLGYTLLHLLRAGKGLWNQEPFYLDNVYQSMSYDISTTRWRMLQLKLTTSIDELCKDLPDIFNKYFQIIRSLGFYETPNYELLISLFNTYQL